MIYKCFMCNERKDSNQFYKSSVTQCKECRKNTETWRAMIDRCSNPRNKNYKNYGGRGITVCPRWHDFSNYYADMGRKPPNMTLERIDNNKGYSPSNCKWATHQEQSNNKRNSRRVEHGGVTKTLSQWATHLHIPRPTLEARLANGWTVDKALSTPSYKPPPRPICRICGKYLTTRKAKGSQCMDCKQRFSLTQRSKSLGLNPFTVQSRLDRGWSPDRIFDQPLI